MVITQIVAGQASFGGHVPHKGLLKRREDGICTRFVMSLYVFVLYVLPSVAPRDQHVPVDLGQLLILNIGTITVLLKPPYDYECRALLLSSLAHTLRFCWSTKYYVLIA